MSSFYKQEKINDSKVNIMNNLKEYSNHSGRNVIVYASNFLTSDEEETYINSKDKMGFVTTIENLDLKKGLDLILHTPGGSISDTESIIDYLHSIFNGDIRAIIPQMAMSGGTMIACSCKEIYMGKQSSLGPVDPQIMDVSAKNAIKEYELAKKEISEQPELLPFWEILLDKYPANFMFECKNTLDWTDNILEKSLDISKPKNINKIKYALNSGDFTKDHSQNLSARQCKEIGLNIKFLENNKMMNKLIMTIHNEYLSFFNEKNCCKIFVNQKGTFLSIDNSK